MEFKELIEKRYSCRSFTDEKIKPSELKEILEAGRHAPTACNFYPINIYVVEDKELLEKLKAATRFTFNSKTILVICYNSEVSWHRGNDGKDHGDIDAAIVTTHMMQRAFDLGIGSCYVCSMKENLCKEILDIPANLHVSAMLPLGYPSEVKPQNSRKSLEDIVIYK